MPLRYISICIISPWNHLILKNLPTEVFLKISNSKATYFWCKYLVKYESAKRNISNICWKESGANLILVNDIISEFFMVLKTLTWIYLALYLHDTRWLWWRILLPYLPQFYPEHVFIMKLGTYVRVVLRIQSDIQDGTFYENS